MQDIGELVETARNADFGLLQRHEAFGGLVERCQDMAYGYAYCLMGEASLAQDAAQESFLIAYRELGQLREPGAFPAWLKRIVHSQCNRLKRQVRRIAAPGDEVLERLADGRPTMVEIAEKRELKEAVLAAVQALSGPERQATVLFYINGYSQAEIATFLGTNPATVRKRIERARNKLREAMVGMVTDSLASDRPSRDKRFLDKVQFALLLDQAAAQGEFAVIEALLVDGVDVNTKGEDGRTLLHWAARRGSLEAVELLLRSGADPNLRDSSGRTALQEAERAGVKEVVQSLREHGAVAKA
jgi:RNA polymerase sigma factor (sigma-70 family)